MRPQAATRYFYAIIAATDPKRSIAFERTGFRLVDAESPNHRAVRPKFVGGLILVFLVPTFLLSLMPLSNLLNTFGVLAPFAWLSARCLRSEQSDFSGLVSRPEARKIWVSCLLFGLLAYYFLGKEASIAWFISAGTFFLYEPFIFDFLVWLGFLPYPKDENYDPFD